MHSPALLDRPLVSSLSPAQITAIRAIPHFRDSHYAAMDLNRIFRFYVDEFVRPLTLSAEKVRSVADIGTGYGWLAIAFALNTDFRILAVDFNGPRVVAARAIAAVLGVADRIEWAVASVDALPFPDRSFDAVYCIEVIEHVSDRPEVVRDLGRVSRRHLTVSTPNKAAPVVFHDTCLPFCHWLHPRFRNGYARLFGRLRQQDNNLFWSPWKLVSSLPEFECLSSVRRFLSPNLRLTFRRAME
ncbi:class I SAM-dependent methyltransferase [Roseomonas marmotae]|uniref:Class I SAM-dependent methyltransferase n=1 Tax=Roseomonas marmotae TaxID=2768161 RepID=A0ABS3K6H1_9PROT|nr:class I SAM-dependent methyltransferase [Roseomonas marmotae]MBO1073051.1 class I SAM-dependent methyltransferase [Roseomonas marmotae]QTI79304.1 class I SAM-dependent methyltransferase [Roseomonas marmotae]